MADKAPGIRTAQAIALLLWSVTVHASGIGQAFFASPHVAVRQIARWLKSEDFGALASHYDLRCSDVKPDALWSGDYFRWRHAGNVGYPQALWKYRRPFPSAFEYAGMEVIDGTRVFRIDLRVVIPQGTGAPDQVGLDKFYMVLNPRGWQIVPKALAEKARWCKAFLLDGQQSADGKP